MGQTEITLLLCAGCGAPLDLSGASLGICRCKYCSHNNILPKDDQTEEVLLLLHEGDTELRNSEFERAYNAFKQASELDPEEARAYFGMALAENRVKYIKDVVNKRYQPICCEITDKRFDSDKNYSLALDYATTDEQYKEYESRAREIDYIREKFCELRASGLKYDTFICVKVSEEGGGFTQDSVWAGKLYDSIKRAGMTPFYSERDVGDRVGEDYEALILYALYSAKSFVLVCGNEEYLRTPWVQNEYSRYYSMLSEKEKAKNSIMIAFIGDVIERIPGIRGKIQGVSLGGFDASQKINDFVAKFATPEKKKTKLCVNCGAEVDEKIRFCPECGHGDFVKDRAELVKLREEEERKAREAEAKKAEQQKPVPTKPAPSPKEKSPTKKMSPKKIKLIAILAAVILVVAIFIPIAMGGSSGGNDVFAYEENSSGGLTLINYNGDDTNVEIPSSKGGKAVTAIGSAAFKGARIYSVKIPESVTYIGESAFAECTELRTVKISSSVTSIDRGAFYNCTYLGNIIFPTELTYIGWSAFYGCTGLTEAILPEGLTTIGNSAFSGCTNLKKVTFPSTLTSIEHSAFASCLNLEEIKLPQGLTEIQMNTFSFCQALTSVTIPDSVTYIGEGAFNYCLKLESVTGGNKVTAIGSEAFSNCTELEIFNMGAKVKTIGDSAFRYCSELTSITLPVTLTAIGENAFTACTRLVEVINLSYLDVTSNASAYGYVAGDAIEVHNGKSRIVKKGEYVFYVSDSENYLIMYDGNSSVITLPESFNGESYVINKSAFYCENDITSVTIPAGVTTIGSGAFNTCSNLTTITINGSGLTEIGFGAFRYCSALTDITIPKSVLTIGSGAFEHCDALAHVYYGGTAEEWAAVDITNNAAALASVEIHFT